MNRMNKQGGFTLIELIVVIVILGILAAVALPRFVNLQRDARVAKLSAARGAVQAAAALAHGSALARAGQTVPNCPIGGAVTTTVNGTVCTETGLIAVENFYPEASVAGIITAAGLGGVANPTPAQLAADGYATTGGGTIATSVITVQVTGGTAPATCSFQYSPTSSAAGAPGGGVIGSAAVVTAITAVNTAGC